MVRDRYGKAPPETRSRLVPFVVVLAVLSISTASIFIRKCQDDAPTPVIAAARLSIATLILAPFAMQRRRMRDLHARHAKYVLAAGAFLAAHFYLWIASLEHTSVLNSVVIVATSPIIVGISSVLILRESMHRALVVAIVLATIGGVVIGLSDTDAHQASLRGDLLAFGGAVAAAAYFLVGRKIRRELNIIAYITPVYGAAAIMLLLIALLTGHTFSGYRPDTYVYFVLLAVIPQLLGHGSLNWLLRYLPATTVAIVVVGEPVGSSILAYVILGEGVSATQLSGGGLIIAGLIIAARAPGSINP